MLCHLEQHVECLSLSLHISFFSPFLHSCASTLEIATVATESSSLQFPIPHVGIAMGFYFQGSGLHLSFSGTWSGPMHKELQLQ